MYALALWVAPHSPYELLIRHHRPEDILSQRMSVRIALQWYTHTYHNDKYIGKRDVEPQ